MTRYQQILQEKQNRLKPEVFQPKTSSTRQHLLQASMIFVSVVLILVCLVVAFDRHRYSVWNTQIYSGSITAPDYARSAEYLLENVLVNSDCEIARYSGKYFVLCLKNNQPGLAQYTWSGSAGLWQAEPPKYANGRAEIRDFNQYEKQKRLQQKNAFGQFKWLPPTYKRMMDIVSSSKSCHLRPVDAKARYLSAYISHTPELGLQAQDVNINAVMERFSGVAG